MIRSKLPPPRKAFQNGRSRATVCNVPLKEKTSKWEQHEDWLTVHPKMLLSAVVEKAREKDMIQKHPAET